MDCYNSEARLLFARERANLLANEMRAARRPANTRPSGSALRRSARLLARLRHPARTARRGGSEAPQTEVVRDFL